MKNKFLILMCLLLGAMLSCPKGWAQGAELGKHITLTYSDGSFNIPTTNFNSSAKSIKVFFDFGEKSIGWGSVAYNRYNAMDGATNLLTLSSSQRYYIVIVTDSKIINEIATNSGISANYGDARSIKVIITNYSTTDGAANDNSEASGIIPSNTPGGVFTGDKKGGYTAEELKAQYNPIDFDKVNLIIKNRRQITNLPTVYITIPDAASATTKEALNLIVKKDGGVALYHKASIKVVDDYNSSLEFEDDALEIKVRGNETAKGDKKPYRLKFAKDKKDAAGNVIETHKHDMLGYGYEKRNWTLIANQKDPSFCHNALSYHIGQAVGMEFCPGYRFIDLVINNIYLGCYMISDHVEVGSNRIKLEDEKTGWYVESNRDDQVEEPYVNAGGIAVSIKSPEPATDAETAALKAEVAAFFDAAQAIMNQKSNPSVFCDPENGWRKYFDEESLVKYYVGENLTGNHDGFMTVKMYRDMGKKMKVGPMWDHDTAFGIYDEGGKTLCEDAQVQAPLFCGKYAKIIADNDPEFMQKANYLLQKVLADGYADNMKKHIADITSSVATSRTIEAPYGNPFQTEIDKLETYITDHTSWLRETVNTKAGGKTIVFPETTVTPPVIARQQLTDVPTIYLDAETITDEWTLAAIEVFDPDGKLNQSDKGDTWKVEGLSKKGNPCVAVQFQGSGREGTKSSYRLKFNDKIGLMASGTFKQWVLTSNDDDPSMIRNALAKELGDAVGLPYTPGYQFVDLYVNGEYMGTYQLTDRVKAEAGRSLVTGGNKDLDWQIQFDDKTEIKENDNAVYIDKIPSAPKIVIKNPDPDDITTEALTELKAQMTTYFTTFFSDGCANVEANADQQQLIAWYISQEILSVYKGFSSVEAYRSITDGAADNLLHFGPLWDSEKAFGNTGLAPAIDMSDLNTEGSHQGLMINYAAHKMMKTFFTTLWTQQWFREGVIAKWNALTEAGLLTSLKAKSATIAATLAQTQPKNASRWDDSLGDYQTYQQAVSAISTYLDQRFAYLDQKFTELATDQTTVSSLTQAIEQYKQGRLTLSDIEAIIDRVLEK